jgi:hypothetical protein
MALIFENQGLNFENIKVRQEAITCSEEIDMR